MKKKNFFSYFFKTASFQKTSQTSQVILKKATIYRQQTSIIQNLSVTFNPGSLIAIVGPNGGGKSTLLETLADPSQMRWRGEINRGRFNKMLTGYLPQRSEMQRIFPLTVKDVVLGGLWHELGPFSRMRPEHEERICYVLKLVGLTRYMDYPMNQLSGGQFQRVLFARLAAQNAELLLLDEPFNGVDYKTQQDLIALIHQWHQEGKTILAVMHDLDVVERFFPETLLLARNYAVFGETKETLQPAFREEALKRSQMWEGNLCCREFV